MLLADTLISLALSWNTNSLTSRKENLDNHQMKGESLMFKIQVWYDNHWKDGIRSYDTLEGVQNRLNRLREVGIVARLKPRIEAMEGCYG